MRKSKRIFAVAILASALTVTLQPVVAQDTSGGNAKAGQALYVSIGCYECHGYSGAGSGQGARLISPPPFQRFLAQLRRPGSVMPPYEANVLSDAQAADIYAYVQSLPKPPDPELIKLLK